MQDLDILFSVKILLSCYNFITVHILLPFSNLALSYFIYHIYLYLFLLWNSGVSSTVRVLHEFVYFYITSYSDITTKTYQKSAKLIETLI